MPEKKLNMKQELLQEMLQESLTRSEFEELAVKLAQHIKDVKEANLSELKKIKEGLDSVSSKQGADSENRFSQLKEEVNSLIEKYTVEFKNSIESKTKEIDDKLANIKDGKDADEDAIVEKVLDRIELPEIKGIEEDLPKMGAPIRDALELLQGGDRLDWRAIRGLRGLIKSFIKPSEKVFVGGGSSLGGHIVKAHDLSGSLNGVLKTFSLPAFWRVISVHSSSYPNAFRPTTDYTIDASAMTITFTSQIDAATTLASGQTVVVTYSE